MSRKIAKQDLDPSLVLEIEVVNTGPKGDTGIQGPKGDKGDKGDIGVAGTTSWTGITDKPTSFPSAPHEHTISQVTGLQDALDAKATIEYVDNEIGVLSENVVSKTLINKPNGVPGLDAWGNLNADLIADVASQQPLTQSFSDLRSHINSQSIHVTAAEKAKIADVGDKATLTTVVKTDLVSAINEVNAKPMSGAEIVKGSLVFTDFVNMRKSVDLGFKPSLLIVAIVQGFASGAAPSVAVNGSSEGGSTAWDASNVKALYIANTTPTGFEIVNMALSETANKFITYTAFR